MDVEQINNIMTNADREEVSFSDAQWLYLPDVNQGSYQNILQFYTTPLKQQFIDYHNAYLRVPFSLEFLLGTGSATTGALSVANHPPLAALRQSVLNLFTNINISTDQGQTIVNDINTQFINNIRLEVENDEGWMRSDGPMLDYAYDRYNLYPSQTVTPSTFGYSTGSQTAPRYTAAQGIEPGTITTVTPPGGSPQSSYPPLTNDPQMFGNNTPAAFAVLYTGATTAVLNPIVTSIAGVIAAATTTNSFTVEFADGRLAYFPYTSGAGGFESIGGVLISTAGTGAADAVAPPVGLTAGNTFVRQAAGYTNVLDRPLDSELVTIPLTFTVVTASSASTPGASVLSAIGDNAFVVGAAASSTVTGRAYGQVAGLNPNANLGFKDRVTLLQNSAEYQFIAAGTPTPAGQQNANGAHVYYYRAIVPLKLLHDFFRQLDFPIINVGFNFQFTFAQQHGANINYTYPPIQTSNNTYLIAGGSDTTPYPSIWYGRETSGAQGTRLYYRVVKFSPADNARMAEKLTTGFTKSIKFISADWFREPVPVSNASATHQFQFSTSVVHPLRVWVQPYPVLTYAAGTAGQVSTPAQSREALVDPTFAPGVVTAYFSQSNIQVNNVPYYRQNFSSVDDLWEQRKHIHQILHLISLLLSFVLLPQYHSYHSVLFYNPSLR
jgi:hypothetical protein